MKNNLFFLMLFSPMTLLAEEKSTYNFYFQKAPGPVTVNQGGASSSTTPNVSVQVPAEGQPVVQPAPTSPAAPQAVVTAQAPPTTRKKWHASLGVSYAAQAPNTSEYFYASGESKKYLSNQISVKGEYDIFERVALTAGIYQTINKEDPRDGYRYIKGVYAGTSVSKSRILSDVEASALPNSRFDYSLGAAVHLLRSPLETATISGIVGIRSYPYLEYKDRINATYNTTAVSTSTGILHEHKFYAGARLRLLAEALWGIEGSYQNIIGTNRNTLELASVLRF